MTLISGIQALLAAASSCRVHGVYAVPGFPITDAVNAFLESESFAKSTKWFSNEKVAFEWGLGTSFSGKRSIVAVKHVGMNVLADPLMTAGIHTIGAGLVVLVGDDPDVSGSQNSQDSRYYGSLSRSPVFDPATPQELYDSLEQAFLISEKLKIPGILRVTDAILKEIDAVQITETAAQDVVLNIESENLTCDSSVWEYRTKGRYLRSHFDNDAVLFEAASDFCTVHVSYENRDNKLGIISSGSCFSRIQKILSSGSAESPLAAMPVLKLGIVSPLPIEEIREFLEKCDAVLVVEESEPFIEDQIRIFGNVLGKRTGHLPFGNVTDTDILSALKNAGSDFVSVSQMYESDLEIYKRGSGGNGSNGSGGSRSGTPFCGDRLYPKFYEMLGLLKNEFGFSVSGDIGCSMYGAVPPFSVLDSAVSLGAGIGIGTGASRARRQKSVVVIGDFGFFHSGLLSLIEAVEKEIPLLVFVMYNSAAAMTGSQKTYNPEKLIRAALSAKESGVSSVHSVFFDVSADNDKILNEKLQSEMEALRALSLDELKKDGVSVIIVRWKP